MQKKFLKTSGKSWLFQKITDLGKYPYLGGAAIKLLFKNQSIYPVDLRSSSEAVDVNVPLAKNDEFKFQCLIE